jgi:hypothetical protein
VSGAYDHERRAVTVEARPASACANGRVGEAYSTISTQVMAHGMGRLSPDFGAVDWTTVSDTPAWSAVGISVVALGFSVTAWIQGERRTKADARRRAAHGPAPEDLRESLVDIRTLFTEITVLGGVNSDWLLDDSRKLSGQRVQDNALRVADDQLRSHSDAVAKTWKTVFALAPLRKSPRVIDPGAPPPEHYRQQDLAYDNQRTQQAEEALARKERCDTALKRLNQLEGAPA